MKDGVWCDMKDRNIVLMTAHFPPRKLLTFRGTVVDYRSYLMVYYILSIRGPEDFEFSFLSILKPFIAFYIKY